MIQYIGLSFIPDTPGVRAVATVVDRKARVIGSGSAPVGGVGAGAGGVTEVRPGEWVRAGSLALRDAFFRIPARTRRVWGFSIAGPPGWVALDPALDPLGPLRLTARPREEILSWLERDPRQRSHVYSLLPPKDYFRYAVSGALATDVTQAPALGAMEPGSSRWSTAGLEGLGLKQAWFPPVFDSAVSTGRLSEEGIRHTGLPGGLWVVAGAETEAGALVSAGDTRAGTLLASAPDPRTLELRCVASGLGESPAPEGFEALPAPFAGHRVLRRRIDLPAGDERSGSAALEAAREALHRLRAAPIPGLRPPERIVIDHRTAEPPPWAAALLGKEGVPASLSPFAGREDPGIAFLAGAAQGAYRSWDDLYRKLREVEAEVHGVPKEVREARRAERP